MQKRSCRISVFCRINVFYTKFSTISTNDSRVFHEDLWVSFSSLFLSRVIYFETKERD
ncbi:MAG: hypothetical protein LIO96_05345 [Lachnospiraceae bacterium]|nr:hypothetical protein [Lachnospiraceae bacterium]